MEKIVFTDGVVELAEDMAYFNGDYLNQNKYYAINLSASGKSIGVGIEKMFSGKPIALRFMNGDKVEKEQDSLMLKMSEQKFSDSGILLDHIRFELS